VRRLSTCRRALFITAIVLSSNAISAAAAEPKRDPSATPDAAGAQTTADIRAIVDALANRNPPPKHSGVHHTPTFAANFDWAEDARVWKALESVIQRAEEAWPELVRRLDDDRYCLTYLSFSGFTYDKTVGTMGRTIILRTLSAGYFESVKPRFKEPHLAILTADFLRDPKRLKSWCEERRGKKLFELQIEMCDWAIAEVATSDVFSRESREDRDQWTAAIKRAADSLRNSKTAVHWKGFGDEEVFRYTSDNAGTNQNKDPLDPLKDPFK
jgi:hypothetical protein